MTVPKGFTRGLKSYKDQIKQTKYALSLAINNTLNDAQTEVRRTLRAHFTLRRPTFIDRLIKRERTDFAKRDNLVGRLRVTGTGAGGRAVGDLLSKFEEGGTKEVRGIHVALPVEAKRNKYDIITAANRPRQLIDKGKAFILPQKSGRGEVVLKRAGRGKNKRNVVLFALEAIRPKIPATLGFFKTTGGTVVQRFTAQLTKAIAKARSTAR